MILLNNINKGANWSSYFFNVLGATLAPLGFRVGLLRAPRSLRPQVWVRLRLPMHPLHNKLHFKMATLLLTAPQHRQEQMRDCRIGEMMLETLRWYNRVAAGGRSPMPWSRLGLLVLFCQEKRTTWTKIILYL